MSKTLKIAMGVVCLFALVGGVNLWGQGIFATLTGVVSDPTNAIVNGAKVTLTDAVSGSVRETVTNSDGYYTFASVPVGKYNLSIEAQGFQSYKAAGIDLGGGEKRNLNVTLTIGAASQTIEVNAEALPLASQTARRIRQITAVRRSALTPTAILAARAH